MEEKEDLELKAEIDQIARKIDHILEKIETAEADLPETRDQERQ